MYLNQYCIDALFNKIDTMEGDLMYWTALQGGVDGYLVIWPKGHEYADHLHTYRYPPDIWG